MSEHEREIELIDYIDVLLRWKWLIAIATLACFAGSQVKLSEEPTWYSAKALIFVAPSQTSSADARTTEMELPTLSPAFYLNVAVADEVRLYLEERRKELTGGSATATMSMSTKVVEQTGIELQIRSREIDLPVPLVKAWTDTFMSLSQGLSANELGSIYKSVKSQFDTAHVRLERSENALASDTNDVGAFMEAESDTLNSRAAELQSKILDKQILLDGQIGEMIQARPIVDDMERGGVALHLLDTEQIEGLQVSSLTGVAAQMVVALRQRNQIRKALRKLSLDEIDSMAAFQQGDILAREHPRLRSFQVGIETYGAAVASARTELLSSSDSLYAVEVAIAAEPPSVRSTRAIVDTELWRQADGSRLSESKAKMLDQLKIYSEAPNPTLRTLHDTRARHRIAIGVAESRLSQGLSAIAAMKDSVARIHPKISGAIQDHKEIADHFEQYHEKWNNELLVVQGTIDEYRRSYESAKRATRLGPSVESLKIELADLEIRLEKLRVRSLQLQRLHLERQRLVRDHETMTGTYDRLAKLTEEARIAAQIASGNLRVITLAKTPVGQRAENKRNPLLAGAIGLILSVFVAFFLEYVRKARAIRRAD